MPSDGQPARAPASSIEGEPETRGLERGPVYQRAPRSCTLRTWTSAFSSPRSPSSAPRATSAPGVGEPTTTWFAGCAAQRRARSLLAPTSGTVRSSRRSRIISSASTTTSRARRAANGSRSHRTGRSSFSKSWKVCPRTRRRSRPQYNPGTIRHFTRALYRAYASPAVTRSVASSSGMASTTYNVLTTANSSRVRVMTGAAKTIRHHPA